MCPWRHLALRTKSITHLPLATWCVQRGVLEKKCLRREVSTYPASSAACCIRPSTWSCEHSKGQWLYKKLGLSNDVMNYKRDVNHMLTCMNTTVTIVTYTKTIYCTCTSPEICALCVSGCVHMPRPTYTKQCYPIGNHLSACQSVSPKYIEKQVR